MTDTRDISCIGRSFKWPSVVYDLCESSDLREVMLGRLLFAGWEQKHAATQMSKVEIHSTLRRIYADQQRRAYRDMVAARHAFNALSATHD